MLNDALYWISGLYSTDIFTAFIGIFLLDAPRYVITKLVLVIIDAFVSPFRKSAKRQIAYYPTVCAIISCLNEGETIYETLKSIYGTYPYLEIIVVDDGSTDETFYLSNKFSKEHPGVLVIKRPIRGGKSSAINLALNYTSAEIVLTLDSDSAFGPNAIFHIVQPFIDSKIGAVSGSILVKNTHDSLCTWMQSFEYLNSILVGRTFASNVGMLSIASGAFAAFRRSAVLRGYGWDVGPGEDADITIRLRKAGWNVVFTSEAECYTNAPVKFKQLFKQRLRWDRSLVRYNVRKHKNVANIFSNNFRLSSFAHWCDIIFFDVFCTFKFWIFTTIIWLVNRVDTLINVVILVIVIYAISGFIQSLLAIYYSKNVKRDILACAVFPIYVFYSLFLRVARTYAIYDELANRSSFSDNYVPKYVRDSTIHW